MSLRLRLVLAMAVSVVVAVLVVSVALTVVLSYQQDYQVDAVLRATADELAPLGPAALTTRPLPRAGAVGRAQFVQVLTPAGQAEPPPGQAAVLPVTPAARRIAAAGTGTALETVPAGGGRVRILTVGLDGGGALEVGEPNEIAYGVVAIALRAVVVFATAGAVAAGVVGLLLSRTVLGPVRRLTGVAEHVARTGDPTTRMNPGGADELGRLARSFNQMLEALETALAAQRRLVSDASHELRTPITSLRTNIEVLAEPGGLDSRERARLTRDLVLQCDELAALVSNLVELAGGDEPRGAEELMRLDLIVADAVERARRHWPRLRYELTLEPQVIRGRPDRISRAVANLLDNASKWTPEGAPVDVAVRDGRVQVRDRGPGVDGADAPFIFDRFYRSRTARPTPGSGLGLAIARQVAEAHDGSASYRPAPGGGSLFVLDFSARLAPDLSDS